MSPRRLLPLLCLLLIGCVGASTEAQPTPAAQATATRAPTHTSATPPTVTPAPTLTPTGPPTATPPIAPTPASRLTPIAASPTPEPQLLSPAWSYPIGWPGQAPGDGFFLRHGFQVENTWFNPGYWHTGEDWYALDGNTAGAEVYAVADGEVVYVGSNYPGRVVIIRHADDLYSMYGHLAFEPPVASGQAVSRGDLIGTVLRRDDNVPDHLHFELRTFLLSREVNGESPRYGFRCGRNCPPGPGYWPIDARELPSALGWLNPTHVLARQVLPSEVIVVSVPAAESVRLYADVDANGEPQSDRGELRLTPSARYRVLDQRVGPDAPESTGADHYRLWYRIALEDGDAWAAAVIASGFESGSDGSPATVRLNFVPSFGDR